MSTTARFSFGGHELSDVPVLNPGDWFGKTWLIEIGGSYSPLFFIVEAGSASDAIDELADHEEHGRQIVIPEEDLADYDLEYCQYGPSGQPLDLDHLMIYGQEGVECPFPCRYFGEGLPPEGIDPGDLGDFDLSE